MNFDPFQKGIASILVGASALFSSLLPNSMLPQTTLALDKPELLSSSNLAPSPAPEEPKIEDNSSFKLATLSQTTETVTAEALTPPDQTVPQVLGASINPPVEEATPEAAVVEGPVLPSPTPKPSPKAKASPKEEASPSPKASASPSSTPEPSTKPQANSLNPDIIMQLINDHRKNIGLTPFEKDERLCKIADERVPQLQNEIFGSGTMHAGLKALNLPYWETENIASYGSEQVIYNWWMSDYIHKKAIESTDNKYSCGACLSNSCAQEFSSFTPK